MQILLKDETMTLNEILMAYVYVHLGLLILSDGSEHGHVKRIIPEFSHSWCQDFFPGISKTYFGKKGT